MGQTKDITLRLDALRGASKPTNIYVMKTGELAIESGLLSGRRKPHWALKVDGG